MASPANDLPRYSELNASDKKTRTVIYLCSAVAIITALVQAYGNRDLIYQTDGITYLDLSNFMLQGRWNDAINSHWSPLYPALLAVTRSLFQSNEYWEAAVVKCTNFGTYILLLVAFLNFLKEFLKFQKAQRSYLTENIPIPLVAFTLFSWFWWSSLVVSGVYIDTPDQIASAAILFASSIVLKGRRARYLTSDLVFMGLALGIGYLAKAAVMPVSLVFFAIVFLISRKNRVRNLCLSLTCFFIIAAPWVATISNKVGHFTFSDSAKWNYRVFVDRTANCFRPRAPLFPQAPRIMCDKPNTFEFATPIAGTYPLWTDPIYWQQGPPLQITSKIFVLIATNAIFYFLLFGLPLSSYFFQYLVNRPLTYSFRPLIATWILLLPASVGLGMYMPLITMTMQGAGRYIVPFIVMLAAGTLASLALQKGNKASLAIILLILIGYPLADFFGELATDVKLAIKTPAYRNWHIAQELSHMGVKPDSLVAVLGSEQPQGAFRCAPIAPPLENLQQSWYYWAHLAHVKIVAQITRDDSDDKSVLNEQDYMRATENERAELYRKLKVLGVKAIIYNPSNRFDRLTAGFRQNDYDLQEGMQKKTAASLPSGWKELDNQECYVYMIQ